MTAEMKQIVINKEDAVFWMDQYGCWRNSGGKFRIRKIIDLFHQSIEKDDDGYFITQGRDGIREKVYFRVEDTALFVFEVLINDDIVLILNTGNRLTLDPGQLYIRDDHLYLVFDNERIKFSERALMQISSIIEEEENHLVIHMKGKTFILPEAPSTVNTPETKDHFYQSS
jgi:hypothetical protein